MKRVLVVCLLVLFSKLVYSNKNIKYPQVDRQFAQYGRILEVIITNEKTVVSFLYIADSNHSIALSSNTILVSNKSNFKVKRWGVRSNEVDYLDFNKYYNVRNGKEYVFFMEFASIPIGSNTISIYEQLNKYVDFYWEGIHIGNGDNSNSQKEAPSKTTPQQRDDSFTASAYGTGFAVTSNGMIVTNYHVIENARKIRVRGINGDFDKLYKAEVVVVDQNNDLAVIKINDPSFSSILNIPYLLSNRGLDTGEEIFVLGYPLRTVMGDEIKLASGLISSKSGYQGDITCYQLSAQVQPGNSGGPLFDRSGAVVGVVNARLLYVESVGYAIKGSYLLSLLSSIEPRVTLPTTNKLVGKSLAEQVKMVSKYIYSIEIE